MDRPLVNTKETNTTKQPIHHKEYYKLTKMESWMKSHVNESLDVGTNTILENENESESNFMRQEILSDGIIENKAIESQKEFAHKGVFVDRSFREPNDEIASLPNVDTLDNHVTPTQKAITFSDQSAKVEFQIEANQLDNNTGESSPGHSNLESLEQKDPVKSKFIDSKPRNRKLLKHWKSMDKGSEANENARMLHRARNKSFSGPVSADKHSTYNPDGRGDYRSDERGKSRKLSYEPKKRTK
uniref:Uncharacterized protein n=1 Tax=Clytia hemisphaerica TaxID=252671 RepID=A0A7M5XJU7_9CNID